MRRGEHTLPTTNGMANSVVMITREGMGYADPVLQHKLLDTYLRLLVENGSFPGAICFYPEGVKLVVDGSPYLERLGGLEQAGVRLIICSTCLAHYDLTDSVKVGIVGGMGDIIEAQARATKVIAI